MLKKYWLEFIVFGAVFAMLMVDLAPDYTFINKAADSIGYAYSAKYLYPSYHTSPPLYLLLSHFFMMIPLGTDAWRMGLVSVLSTMGACLFIYLVIRKQIPDKKFYALLGVLMYGTSAIVISQSVIIQTYPLVCMLAVGAYFFAISKKWKSMGLILGIGLAVHLLIGFVFLIMLGFKEYRKNWRALAITFSFLIFYIYIPLTNRPPYMWLPSPQEVNSVWAFILDTALTIMMLIGQLAIWDFPKRVLDTIGIIGVSMGVITIVPIVFYFWKTKVFKSILFWLSITPIALFVSELDMNTYDYTMLAIPFLTIVSCLGLKKMVGRFGIKAQQFSYATLIVIIGFGAFNANYFDVGRTLDPNLSASQLYYKEFAKIPDKAIFMPNYAWEWEAIYKYNKDYDKNIYPICADMLNSELYRKQLAQDGIKFLESNAVNKSVAAGEIAQSIVRLNDNVWTTISVDPGTFGSEVVPTNKDDSLILAMDAQVAYDFENNPQWKFTPYNPYDIITTSITVTEWRTQLFSNWNVLFFSGLIAFGLILNWLLFILPKKRSEVRDGDIPEA
jgi:hypothetical protein